MTRMVKLRVEAEIEAARLTRTRALDRDGDHEALAQLEAEGPWILVARRSVLRRRLAGRVLLVWRVARENAAGCVVDSCLVALAVQPPEDSKPRTRASRTAVLIDIEILAAPLVDDAVRDWRESSGAAARSFFAARLARETAIAAAAADGSRELDEYQPGLFDRRAERAHEQAADAGADGRRDASGRAAVLERSAELIVRPPRQLLAVMP
jgi:hypothetical protein